MLEFRNISARYGDKEILRDVGFTHTYTLTDNRFVPVAL